MAKRFTDLLHLSEQKGLTASEGSLRKIGLNALIDAINAVLPENLIKDNVVFRRKGIDAQDEISLHIKNSSWPLSDYDEIIIVGGGKATLEMVKTFIELLDAQNIMNIRIKGLINIPYGQTEKDKIISAQNPENYVILNGSAHPVPDENGLNGVKEMYSILKTASEHALVLTFISGGGSALMPLPADGIHLDDLQRVNQILLESGLEIYEINCIRKHLSAFKGGQLVRKAHPNPLISLVISDVIGNDLQTIASGPTVPDHTTFSEAVKICKKYNIWGRLPESVRGRFEKGKKGNIEETPKPDSKYFEKSATFIIGSALTSSKKAKQSLETQGISAKIFSNELKGEAREYGKVLFEKLKSCTIPGNKSIYGFIGTGEFTVTLKGDGKGGRNQEMLLSFLNETFSYITNTEGIKSLKDIFPVKYLLISGAFDGIEGNCPAMGGLVDSYTFKTINELSLGEKISDYLENNDSFSVFDKLNSALITGQTKTNVNDMTIILVEK